MVARKRLALEENMICPVASESLEEATGVVEQSSW